jgi:beta-lactamase regulating signal transducer with metallopeptidase domain
MAVAFAVVGAACLCLRRASAHWRYLSWLVVLIKCVVPPLVPISFPAAKIADGFLASPPPTAVTMELNGPLPDPSPSGGERERFRSGLPLSPTLSPSEGERENLRNGFSFWRRANWPRWIVGAWAAAGLGYLVVALVKAGRIQSGLMRRRTWPDMELECEFLQLAKTVAIGHRPKLCLIRGLSQPFVWGIARGSIYLPEHFGRQGTARERMLVMSHELAHVLRWDALINFLQVVVQAIFIFHPLVWWLNRLIRHEREKCCDEMAVASLDVPPEEYGSAIINRLADYFEPACPPSSLAISGRAKDLEDRIESLLRTGRSFHRHPTVLVQATVLCLALLVLPARLATRANSGEATAMTGMPGRAMTLLDLSGFTNASLAQSWLPGTADDDLSALETGRHVFGGVPFEVSGIVQLSAASSDTAISRFPGALKGIKVGREFSRLHLLHACAGKEKDGVVIAKVIVHYEDGAKSEMPIVYGSQLRDWQFWEFEPVSGRDTAMAWTGENLYVRAQNGSLGLYRTSWTNARPAAKVVSIDYVSAQTRSAPFLVALTVE